MAAARVVITRIIYNPAAGALQGDRKVRWHDWSNDSRANGSISSVYFATSSCVRVPAFDEMIERIKWIPSAFHEGW